MKAFVQASTTTLMQSEKAYRECTTTCVCRSHICANKYEFYVAPQLRLNCLLIVLRVIVLVSAR